MQRDSGQYSMKLPDRGGCDYFAVYRNIVKTFVVNLILVIDAIDKNFDYLLAGLSGQPPLQRGNYL